MPAQQLTTGLRPCTLPLSPLEAARGLRGRPGFVWCDSSDEASGRVSVMTCDPVEVLHGASGDWPAVSSALQRLASSLAPAGGHRDLGLPGPGLFGSVDFDGSWCFGVYPSVLVYHHDSDQWWEAGSLVSRIDPRAVSVFPTTLPAIDFQPLWSRDGFVAAVRRALDYIGNGDIYQVNLSQPWSSRWPSTADTFAYYERLRAFSPAPHGAFFDLGGRQIASASPELFLRLSGRTVRTRPIKGTRPRHRAAHDDERAAYDLITSPKEIAELIMITDLERNDLGQICEFGSVVVPDLLRLERFQQVFHLVSTVEGTLREGVDHATALRACLPGGSISGAPKIRALEIIRELEPFPRGLYTGVLGWFGVNGESQFSIAIRTAVAEAGRLHFHAGAGIVADSDPAREYEETWHKAATLLGAARWQR
jgi:anthranilate/para-aminobenzoate synthase component I